MLPSDDIYKYNFSNFGSSDKDESEGSSATKNKKNEDLEAQRSSDRGLHFCHSNCCKF